MAYGNASSDCITITPFKSYDSHIFIVHMFCKLAVVYCCYLQKYFLGHNVKALTLNTEKLKYIKKRKIPHRLCIARLAKVPLILGEQKKFFRIRPITEIVLSILLE